MTNEVFSFPRFGKYFKYDLTQMWRNNGKAVVMLGGISLIVYLIWVIFSLVFTGTWQAPGIAVRTVVMFVGWIILVFYQTRTYGYLTEKRAGSSWLMVPASTLEKFISMFLITVILQPLAYFFAYLLVDGLICLLDPTAGTALVSSVGTVTTEVNEALAEGVVQGFQVHLWMFAIPVILQAMYNLMYFLLCGICFKKWKLIGAFAVLIGFSMLSTLLFSLFAWGDWVDKLEMIKDMEDPVTIVGFMNVLLTVVMAVDLLFFLLMGTGIYYRIKTLKH